MGLKKQLGRTVQQRMYSAHGVPRYRSRRQELEDLQKRAKRTVPKLPARKPKLMGIPRVKVR